MTVCSSTPSPAMIRSIVSTPRVEPIRQGVHLPQLSTAQNSIANRAICAMSTLSSNRVMRGDNYDGRLRGDYAGWWDRLYGMIVGGGEAPAGERTKQPVANSFPTIVSGSCRENVG